MKLALVYPPFFAKAFNENLATVDDEFGLFPHIGFGWVARGAQAAGWDVRLWDAPATKKSLDTITKEVEAYGPDLIGFSSHAAQTIQDMLPWAKAIRARTGIPTVTGGYEAKVYVEELMSHGCFDFLCGGEGHEFLPEFLPAFERGGGYERVADLAYRSGGQTRITFPGKRPLFSEFPTPDRSIFDNSLYYSHISQRKHFTIGMSEVGCPYPCTFCCMRQSGYQARTPEQVLTEIEECIALGIREIDWFDPLMLHDRERAMAIAKEIKRRKLDVIWSCRSRVDSLSHHSTKRGPDEEFIQTLAEGGCRRIYFGVEAGDDDVLKGMMKGQSTTAELRKTLECVQAAGIMSLGFFILGAPGDTKETVRKTVDFSVSLPLAYAQYQIAIIKPHTELERKYVVDALGIDYWREYVKGAVSEHLLPTPWTELPRAALEDEARRAYFKFYARPRYALSMLRRIESFEELARYMRVGVQLALRPLRPKTHVSTLKRYGRAALAFVEAALTVANPGARHAVFKNGGGLAGALSLARGELRRPGPEPTLSTERVAELGIAPPPADAHIENKYVPFFDKLTQSGLLPLKSKPTAAKVA